MKLIRKLLYSVLLLSSVAVIAFFVIASNQETEIMNEDARKNASGNFVPLSNGVTHYKELGPPSGSPVLLIHGGGITGMEVWKNNASFLADQGYRVLLYDLYGRGYSDRVEQEYNPELLAEQINELVTSLKYSDTLSIISMSLGSMVALDFAARYPEKVKRLILIDPAATGDYKPSKLLRLPVISQILMTLYWYPKAVENQRKEFVDQSVFDEYVFRLRYFMRFKGYKKMNYSTWLHTLNQSKISLLQKVKPQRVLLLYGSEDPYFPKTNVALYQDVYPSLQVKEIAQAGHMPHFEKSSEVNPLLKDFLSAPY